MKAPFQINKLPNKPGCYIYKDKNKKVIYIGKAKNIRKRVRNYFSKDLDIKTTQLVKNICFVDFIITPNEEEALLLEANLIRKQKPKYNIDLKYGVRYAWILLTKEEYPRILTARDKKRDGEYFGPFVSGTLRKNLIEQLQKQFFIRTCRVLPKKTCLRYHMGLCKAPCVGKQSKEDYQEEVEKVRKYLSGKNNELIKELSLEMQTNSQNKKYEKAQRLKEQIESLENLQKQILVDRDRTGEEDVINYIKDVRQIDSLNKSQEETNIKLMVFSFRRGVLQDKQTFKITEKEDWFDEFLKRYYDLATPPQTIIVPKKTKDENIEKFLSIKANYKVNIIIPKKGLKKKLLELVHENLIAEQTENQRLAYELQELLKTPYPINTIECFDISHHSGTSMVGSMVHFKKGKPLKSKYRKFKIQTVEGIDDFRAMYEIVYRRYKRLRDTRSEFPDIIIVDGGELQLKFAKRAIDELGLNIAIVGLAKKFEEIYFPNKKKPIRYDKKLKAMKTIILARDEAHRFGIKYHRLLKSKKTLENS